MIRLCGQHIKHPPSLCRPIPNGLASLGRFIAPLTLSFRLHFVGKGKVPVALFKNLWDVYWMQQALALAQQAANAGEVPVGAVLVKNGQLLSSAHNQPIALQDPTAHAEILAIRNAAQKERNYRLPETTLYVTLEPCTMCVGALVHARVKRLVFGATDPKSGVVKSCGHYLDEAYHNHRVEYVGGVLEKCSTRLLWDFFEKRRASPSE